VKLQLYVDEPGPPGWQKHQRVAMRPDLGVLGQAGGGRPCGRMVAYRARQRPWRSAKGVFWGLGHGERSRLADVPPFMTVMTPRTLRREKAANAVNLRDQARPVPRSGRLR